MPQHVFTYGSLMFAPVWRRVVSGDYAQRPARLAGYARRAVRGASYPAIVPAEGGVVDGVLYLDVDDADLARLDAFEDDPYERRVVRVDPLGEAGQPDGDPLAAGTYVWRDEAALEAHAWDATRFEREAIESFIASYCAPRGVG